MTHDHSALIAQLDALKGADLRGYVRRPLIRAGLQALIDAQATEVLGAGRYERTSERTNYHRSGAVCGDHGGLRPRCVDPQRR